MAVSEAAVSSLLDNVSQVLVYSHNLDSNVRENILRLEQQLLALRGLMKDFSRYNHDSEFLKSKVNEIRGIIGEAEDAIDTYLLQAAVQGSRGWVSKHFHKCTDYPIVLREVGRLIEDVGDVLKKINEDSVKNGFQVLQYQATASLNRAGNSIEVPEVVDLRFDEAVERVRKRLTTGAQYLEVISIVGMLGLGKTTLALRVYQALGIDYIYRAFAYVSKDFDKKEVLLQILGQFTQINEEVSNLEEDQLEKRLYEKLEGKQYLIVLDDIWVPKDWDKFKDAFPKNNKRCRVLITTRYGRVATYANPTNINAIYRLNFLRLEESQKLLRWRIFHENHCPEELQEYEVEIAAKCNGFPFALLIIAGILVNDPYRVDWWKCVANGLNDYEARNLTQTHTVIDLMYKHLPNYLKPCFLYLGVFPEDFEIPVWKLVRLWISEGFIQQEGNFNLEDIAEQYLEELVHRNLVMIGQRRSNDRIKTCRMHDTLREFCKREATEENLFREIKKDELESFLSGSPNLDQYRRLCINNINISDYISGTPSGKCVRSFLTFVKEETSVEPKHVACIPKNFKLLRVLEIQSLIFTRFPVDLCSLVLLKYVAISSNFTILPSQLSALWNLQTLIVRTTSPTIDIKVDLWNIPHFRHLHTNTSSNLPVPTSKSQTTEEDIVSATNVQTLSTISPESCKREIFYRTSKIKKLGIYGTLAKLFELDGESTLFSHLSKLEWLENLKLLNDDKNNKLCGLPQKKSFPVNLTKLTLLNTSLDWKEMRTLGELENLEVLKLKEYAFQGKLWQTENGGFQRLKHLHIGPTDLELWEASVDHFPKLKSLELRGCNKLQVVPHGFAEIISLQLMKLHYTNPQVVSSARRIQVLKFEQDKKANRIIKFQLFVYPPEDY